MSLRDFISKQFIDVIEWVEPEDGILAYRYPMQDREIQNGGKLNRSRFANGGICERGQSRRCLRSWSVHPEYAHTTDTCLSEEVGQSVQISLQIRRLFLLDPAADQPALGNAEPDYHSRQGIRCRFGS